MEKNPTVEIEPKDQIDFIRSVLKQEAKAKVRVTGCSMRPCIESGEQVLIEPIQECRPHFRVGEIYAVVQDDQRLYVHRLVKIICHNNGLETFSFRGDALTHLDPPATAAQILGRVISISGRRISAKGGVRGHISSLFFRFRPWLWVAIRKLT